MKSIPILYQTLMVQAIQQDRKTKTRRLKGLNRVNEKPGDWDLINHFKSDFGESITFQFVNRTEVALLKFPFGKVGDVLWVRETWKPKRFAGHELEGYDYKADHVTWLEKNGQTFTTGSGCETGEVWRPSIFMPKTACRIFLEITDVTVERLQDISEEDAIAEGIELDNSEGPIYFKNYQELTRLAEFEFSNGRCSFESLWKMINGPTSWDANPWVWVISFKKIDKPVNFI